MQTELKVAEFIRRYSLIRKGDTVTVGVSGGADSLSLLFLLREISAKQLLGGDSGFSLRAVHVHHGIREESADEDAEYSKEICEKLDIPFELIRVDVPGQMKKGESLEEAARRLRYAALIKSAGQPGDENNTGLIAVGHHMDDQAETVLHNLFRGTGIKGLAGIRPRSKMGDAVIIRPLLEIGRSEIEDYLSKKGIKWRIDETNLTTDYTRNRIRHEILPQARLINSAAALNVARAAARLGELEDFVAQQTREAYEACVSLSEGRTVLDSHKLGDLHPVIAQGVIRLCIEASAGALKDITAVHVEEVAELARLSSGKRISLPYNVTVLKEYDTLVFFRESEEAPFPETSLRIVERETTGEECDFPKDSCIKWFDYDKIRCSVQWRRRQEGDYIITGAGRQSIKDFFIKQKIPVSQRSSAVILAKEGSGEVLWVYAGDVSRVNVKYLTDRDTKKILEARIENERKH